MFIQGKYIAEKIIIEVWNEYIERIPTNNSKQ